MRKCSILTQGLLEGVWFLINVYKRTKRWHTASKPLVLSEKVTSCSYEYLIVSKPNGKWTVQLQSIFLCAYLEGGHPHLFE